MKKTLLATAMVAMAFGAADAATIQVLNSKGEEVANGSTIVVNALDVERDEGGFDDGGTYINYTSESYEMNAHLSFVNTSSEAISMGGKRVTVKEGPEGWNPSWCIGMNCVSADEISPQPMAAGQKFEGNQSHIYMMLGNCYIENEVVIDDSRAGYGEAEYQYTLYVGSNPEDCVTFNIKFVYSEESPVYINGELGVETVGTDNAKAVYYNLQGVRVSTPEKGRIYIVKRGNKVSKEVIR